MFSAKITTVGNSSGIVLPKEILASMRVSKGDTLHFIETKYGFYITPYDETFQNQMTEAEKIMDEDRKALRMLAK